MFRHRTQKCSKMASMVGRWPSTHRNGLMRMGPSNGLLVTPQRHVPLEPVCSSRQKEDICSTSECSEVQDNDLFVSKNSRDDVMGEWALDENSLQDTPPWYHKKNHRRATAPVAFLGLAAMTGGGLMGSGFDISGPGSVLEALGVLAAVVGVHELGHFTAARSQNIHVKKFAIGFDPILWKYQGKEIEYSLRAIPLGGFVSFPDDDEESPYAEDDPDLLTNRPVRDRVIVTCAGVAANIVFALLICVTQAGLVGITEPQFMPGVILGTINPDTVAEKAGLRKGDIVLELEHKELTPKPGVVKRFVDIIRDNPKHSLDLRVKRDGEIVDLKVTPAEMPDGTGRIGVSLAPNVKFNKLKANNAIEAVGLGFKEFSTLFLNVFNGATPMITLC